MASIDKIKSELIKFGLAENQAAIYLLLVQHQDLRVQQISNLTGIPRSSVYESIKNLLDLGLAEEIVGDNFKKFRPYPISLVKHRLNEQILNFQKKASELDKLEKDLTLLPISSQATTAVRYYQDTSGARQLLWNTLRATETVYVYSAWGRGRAVGVKFYESFVRESRERAIQERVLINPTPRAIDSIRRYQGTPIARTNVKDVRALDEDEILIKGETFIYNNIYAQIYLKDEKINGFEIESTQFTQTQRSIFNSLWNKAKPVSVYLASG